MSRYAVKLPATLKIDAVDELRKILDRKVQGKQKVTIDATEVHTIDFCALQLLILFKAELTRRDRELTFSGVSEPFRLAVDETHAGAFLDIH